MKANGSIIRKLQVNGESCTLLGRLYLSKLCGMGKQWATLTPYGALILQLLECTFALAKLLNYLICNPKPYAGMTKKPEVSLPRGGINTEKTFHLILLLCVARHFPVGNCCEWQHTKTEHKYWTSVTHMLLKENNEHTTGLSLCRGLVLKVTGYHTR